MYKSIPISLAIICLSIGSAMAQPKKEMNEAVMNLLFEKFKKIQADAKEYKEFEKETERLADEMAQKIDQMVAEKKHQQEIANKSYKPGYTHKPGEINLFPIWEEIPAPIPSLPEAAKVNFQSKYQSYIDKVTMLKKQMSDAVQQYVGNQRSDKQSMMNDAKAMADQNAIVQQMGGAEAVMNMSEADRKKAAKQAAAQIKSNPGGFAPNQDAGMKAMMEKMMNDPQYRAAYNKMSDAEKQAELKKFMTTKQVERNDAEFEKMLKDRNKTLSAMDVYQLLGKCLQQMQQAAKPYSDGTELANKFYNSIYTELEAWYRKQYDALPLTNTREKIGHANLLKCKEIILYAFQQKEAATRTALWGLLKANTKIAFGEFNDMIGNYPWGQTKNASMMDGNYTEAKVAEAVNSIYDEMIRMAKAAESLTSNHKGQQDTYDLIVNGKS